METCFLNHVLSFSLVVAFLVVPSTLEARTYTTTDKGAEGITLTGGSYSTGSGTQEQEGDTAQSLKTAASSAPAVTRSMHTETSTLHRRSGWRQTAGNFGKKCRIYQFTFFQDRKVLALFPIYEGSLIS
jgi:hypothetical protein